MTSYKLKGDKKKTKKQTDEVVLTKIKTENIDISAELIKERIHKMATKKDKSFSQKRTVVRKQLVFEDIRLPDGNTLVKCGIFENREDEPVIGKNKADGEKTNASRKASTSNNANNKSKAAKEEECAVREEENDHNDAQSQEDNPSDVTPTDTRSFRSLEEEIAFLRDKLNKKDKLIEMLLLEAELQIKKR